MNHPNISIRQRWTASICAAISLMLLVLVFLPGNLQAQSVQGVILGTVKDTSGALVPGATVSLKSLDEGAARIFYRSKDDTLNRLRVQLAG